MWRCSWRPGWKQQRFRRMVRQLIQQRSSSCKNSSWYVIRESQSNKSYDCMRGVDHSIAFAARGFRGVAYVVIWPRTFHSVETVWFVWRVSCACVWRGDFHFCLSLLRVCASRIFRLFVFGGVRLLRCRRDDDDLLAASLRRNFFSPAVLQNINTSMERRTNVLGAQKATVVNRMLEMYLLTQEIEQGSWEAEVVCVCFFLSLSFVCCATDLELF